VHHSTNKLFIKVIIGSWTAYENCLQGSDRPENMALIIACLSPHRTGSYNLHSAEHAYLLKLSHSASREISRLLWNRRFITVFTTARHWSLSWATCIQSTLIHPICLRSVLILFSLVFRVYHRNQRAGHWAVFWANRFQLWFHQRVL